MDNWNLVEYSQMTVPLVAVAARGEEMGALNGPRGIAYREESKEIFIADERNSRIQIFNIEGKFIFSFGNDQLEKPSNLFIDGQCLYVTDWGWQNYCLFKFDLTTLKFIKKIGKNSFDASKDYNLLRQPELGPGEYIYIPDNNNNRICVFSKHLERVNVLEGEGLDNPVDIKFRSDKVFILNNNSLLCVHIFTLQNSHLEKVNSIISRGELAEVLYPNFFLIDSENRIIVSDFVDHFVKVFSPTGDKVAYIGREGNGFGELCYPMGIQLTADGKLIVVSSNEKFGLQIF